MEENNNIVIYQTDDGTTKIDVKLEDETVWLSQQQMADLYDTTKQNISLHIKNIFDEEELDINSTVKEFLTVQKEGNRKVERKVKYYNLDMIISLGYRIKSKIATNFRRWATERLKEYMIKGFTMDDERLKGNGGGNYWKELLARIKDIRSSEKVMYRQVLDLYATAVDYNPKDEKSIEFFKIVQNKLHYATHGHTASEVIYERADAEKPFMGLTTFKGDIPVLQDIVIAKNYLNEEELKVLNNLVSGYFDFAEIQAIRHNPMHMDDYIKQLDMILSSTGEKLLIGAGSVTHNEAYNKVNAIRIYINIFSIYEEKLKKEFERLDIHISDEDYNSKLARIKTINLIELDEIIKAHIENFKNIDNLNDTSDQYVTFIINELTNYDWNSMLYISKYIIEKIMHFENEILKDNGNIYTKEDNECVQYLYYILNEYCFKYLKIIYVINI